VGKKNHPEGIKGTKFKFTSRDLDVFFPNMIDHYLPQEGCSPYTKEGKKKISRLLNSNKLYVSSIVMYE